MGKQTIFGNIKEWLAGICWHLFLKLNNLTEYEYFLQIKEQELRTDESRPLEKLVMPKIAEDYNVLYHELLLSAEKKHPNETRHETALRYIQETEHRAHSGDGCKAGNLTV